MSFAGRITRTPIPFDPALGAEAAEPFAELGADVAELIQGLTWPVSKLLEVKVMGTMDDPDWRPENLPKELFLKFD